MTGLTGSSETKSNSALISVPKRAIKCKVITSVKAKKAKLLN